MAKRIEKLTLNGFRGATCPVEIEFDVNKPAVMIFGENGTGKSTLVDAIDFVCNGEYGSLTDRSSTKPKIHLPSIGTTPGALQVSLNFGGESWSAGLGRNGPETIGSDKRPSIRILRRSQILRVISAQANERYKVLQDFIAVPGIQKCENSLREALKTVERELNDTIIAKQQAEDTLENLWKAEGSSGGGYLQWAKEKVNDKPDDLEDVVSASEQILAVLNEAIITRNQLRSDQLEQARCDTEFRQSSTTLQEAEAKNGTQDSALIAVLEDTKAFLNRHRSGLECPVCEREIDTEKLRRRVADRLAAMHEMVSLKQAVDLAKKKTESAANTVAQARKKLVNAVAKLVSLGKRSPLEEMMALTVDWDRYPAMGNDNWEAQTLEAMEEVESLLDIVTICRTPLITRKENAKKTLSQLTAIQTHVKAIEEKTLDTERLSTLTNRLKAILEVVEKQRKSYVENVLTNISESVEDLYSKIHPNEQIGGIRLYLKPNVIGCLEFDSRFQTESEVPPQAYYSDSHLDTLGVCIFLALAKHFKDSDTVVVLDDVVTSADQAHMERFIQALHDEAPNFNQLIITTHYRPWRDKYVFARGPAGNIQLLELLHWSFSRGIRHTRTKLSAEELSDYAKTEPLDRQIVTSKAGILLESLLDHIALLYRCRLPRQTESNYSLGDLMDCMGKRLRKAMNVQQIADDGSASPALALELMLGELAGMTWIRNQVGCHWNVAGMSVPDNEVALLAERTIQLAETLVCNNCGELPRRDNPGTCWGCRCGRKRLSPLINPD
jgi:energy-coupling factor transporter ATP-binding protein EcfA2